MRLGFVLVHFHTADLLELAVKAIACELESTGSTGDILVVDNGSTREELALIEKLPVRILSTDGNPGYAAAINLGMSQVEGNIVFLMNPDVLVQQGCVAELAAALEGGVAVAGPRLFWDRDRELLLPPTEERTRRAEILARLASRGPFWAKRARRRWRSHARRHWLAQEPIDTESLSGALLAVRRDAFEAVGAFDEGFRLYFEESDYLRRVRKQGLRSVHVPAAEAVHLYNQSGAQQPAAAGWAAESQKRFEKRHYGFWFSWLLTQLEGAVRAPASTPLRAPEEAPSIPIEGRAESAVGSLWVEISPLARGFPAAAARIDATSSEWRFPRAVWQRMAAGRYFTCICSDSGQELSRSSVERAHQKEIGI